MKKINSMRDVLDFAISGESKAAELYLKIAVCDGIRIADVLNTAFFMYRIDIRSTKWFPIPAVKQFYRDLFLEKSAFE